jgi:archaellum component FlaF (FlaF/FlaG flagellin family)
MKNQKGISAWAVILIIALMIGAGILWSKYFAKPTAEVMMQGADQAKPAIEKAHQASDSVERANQLTEETAEKIGDYDSK